MKNIINFIKELKQKPYGKGVFFFGFYLIFFIIVFIVLNAGGNKTNDVKEDNSKFNTSYLEKYDYSFEYKVILDNNTYSYIGNKKNNIYNYTYNGKDYYIDNGINYTKDDSKEVENPIKFNKLFDVSMMDRVINSSYIESNNTYDSGEVVYNLLVSSNTLNYLLDGKDTDIDEVPNKIKISINNGFINEINYKLDSYCSNNNACNSLNIIISYKEFNEVS